ncbi:hypothetical protein [Bradyrhizobium sp. P5_C11_2]
MPSSTPLSVSVTVWPTTAAVPPETTVPVMVCTATLLISDPLVMAIVGAMLSSRSTTAALLPVLP